jgi:hypothetical protein
VHPLAGNAYLREIKRLGIHFPVHTDDKEFAEIGRVDVAGRKNRFAEILSAACIVIVIRRHVRSRLPRRRGWARLPYWRVAIAANQMQLYEPSQKNRA